jgi:hypothetical protein
VVGVQMAKHICIILFEQEMGGILPKILVMERKVRAISDGIQMMVTVILLME